MCVPVRHRVRRSCFLRGSHVRFMVLPDILKNAPFFKKIDTKANKQRSAAGKAKTAAKERVAGERRTPGMPPEKGARKREGNSRNPSFN